MKWEELKQKQLVFEVLSYVDVSKKLSNPITLLQKIWNRVFKIKHENKYWIYATIRVNGNCPAMTGDSLADKSGTRWIVIDMGIDELRIKTLRTEPGFSFSDTMVILSSSCVS